MSTTRTDPRNTYEVRSFIGDAAFLVSDPVEAAMESTTRQVNDYLEGLCDVYQETHQSYKVISTSTHALGTGDYFNYIITLTIEFTDDEQEEIG